MTKLFLNNYHEIISLDNLLAAWAEFARGKCSRCDLQEFERDLMFNLITLHQELVTKTYTHLPYEAFKITDPKPRAIHKASVRDRVLHHAIYRQLYWFYHQLFITDSFSCRLGKGTHRALERFQAFAYRVSKNNTKTCWVLKCDIRKFFVSIDQSVILRILAERIQDQNILWLLKQIITSFSSTQPGIGLPLGNLTSQLLVNVYMNEFDQFVKHQLKIKYYLRYADDFVVLHQDKHFLQNLIPVFAQFLREKLKLTLHPDKVFIKTLASGVDFLGWVHFPNHRVLRTATKRRMMRAMSTNPSLATVNSYLGLLRHGNSHKLTAQIIV